MRHHFRQSAPVLILCVAVALGSAGEENPGNSGEIIARAKKLSHAGKNDDAVKLLHGAIATQEKRLQETSKDAAVAFELAQLQFELQQDKPATHSIELAISLRPSEPRYHAFRGKILSYGADKDAAERAFQKAIELAPKQGTYYCQYSQLLYTLKKQEASEVQLRKAIEAEPSYADAYSELAFHRADAGKKEDALALLRQGIEQNPKDPGLRDALGQMYQTAGKFAEAHSHFAALAELEPANLRAQAKLVQLCLALGKTEQSQMHVTNVYKLFREGRAEQAFFCREQFTVGKNPVLVMEFFELKGPEPMKYSFLIMDENGKKKLYSVSLGSYSLTTEAARESGSIKKDERMYHLDYYQGREHRTYGMFEATPPSYDDVRTMVVEIIAGKRQPISSSKRGEDGNVELRIPAR